MKNNKNLQNFFLLISVIIILGLGCSKEEPPKTKRATPRITETPYTATRNTTNENMSNTSGNKTSENTVVDRTNFYSVLEYTLNKHNLKKSDIYDEKDPVQQRIVTEYGALFLTATATPPPTCIFKSADEVNNFQNKVGIASENIAGTTIELQPSAMKALLEAREEAKSQGLSITPRDGAEAARRRFDETLRLWNSRFNPACEYWKKKGKLTDEQINRLKSLPMNEQVKEVLELEKQGIYFNTFFNATILSSVAAPGTSPHLSMYAFDANEFNDPKVRKIMGNHGWFRTIKGDEPHFTFLGVKEEELENMGLKKIDFKGGEFWIPNV